MAYWGLALALTWIPTYAAQVQHYSPETVGYLTATQWLAGGLLVFGSGAVSQVLKQRGSTSRVSRGLLCAACAMLGGCCTILMSRWEPGLVQMALQIMGIALPSVVFAIGPAMLSEVVPLSQRGALLGANTAFQTTAGLIAPLLMGWMLDGAASPAAGFQQGFLLAGVLALVGGVAGLLLLRPETDAYRLGSAPVLVEAAPAAGGR